MARFTNQAQLLYNNQTIPSNIAVGEITEALNATKLALVATYEEGDKMSYVLNLANTSNTDLTGLTVTDNLGGYTFNTGTVYPMTYIPDSVKFLVNGALSVAPAVTAGPPLIFSNVNIPANGNVTIIYETQLNGYAPLAPADSVRNTATVAGAGLVNPITAQEVVTPVAGPILSIFKEISPVPVAENGRVTYTFTIANRGSGTIVPDDNVVITDTFLPVLSNLTATFNGIALVENVNYTYNPTTGAFSTIPGTIIVPEATFEQDQTTGIWSANPGTSTLVISGDI